MSKSSNHRFDMAHLDNRPHWSLSSAHRQLGAACCTANTNHICSYCTSWKKGKHCRNKAPLSPFQSESGCSDCIAGMSGAQNPRLLA